MSAMISFVCGILFSVGLSLSGMTQPHIVIGFLDWNRWNPTLIFVMVGAISIHALSYFLIKRRKTPLLDSKWHIPSKAPVTKRLVIGALIFGFGWGLGGLCPGPAWTSLASGSPDVLAFVLCMLAGMKAANLLQSRIQSRSKNA